MQTLTPHSGVDLKCEGENFYFYVGAFYNTQMVERIGFKKVST
jgi:hypothetical protein